MIRSKSLKLLCLFLTVFMFGMLIPYGSIPAQASVFNDLGSAPNAAYITYVSQLGLMTGYPDGGFHPNGSISRAQVAVIMVKAMKLNVSTGMASGFKDVPARHWAAPYIGTAVKAGYLTGSTGLFRPDDSLTRAQGISLLLRLSKQPDSGAALPSIGDVDEKYWAARSIAVGLDAGMVSLDSSNNFNPNTAMTRADLAKALAVLLTNDPDLSTQALKASLISLGSEVVIIHLNKEKSLKISNSSSIEIGDTVKIGDKGKARIEFPDGSSLLLENNTELVIKEMQGRAYIKKSGLPGVGVDYIEVELPHGTLFGGLCSLRKSNSSIAFNSRPGGSLVCLNDRFDLLAATDQKIPWYKVAEQKRVKVKVDMPWGISAIRGSFWSNNCNETSTYMTLLEGDGEFIVGDQARQLTPGQGSSIKTAGGMPDKPSIMTVDEQRAWSKQKDWAQSTVSKMSYNQEYGVEVNSGAQLKQFIDKSFENLNDGSAGSGGGGGGCGG
ncbi:MAG: S-layer homology domain-containing protein [Deltaproteobacteria bacterium]